MANYKHTVFDTLADEALNVEGAQVGAAMAVAEIPSLDSQMDQLQEQAYAYLRAIVNNEWTVKDMKRGLHQALIALGRAESIEALIMARAAATQADIQDARVHNRTVIGIAEAHRGVPVCEHGSAA